MTVECETPTLDAERAASLVASVGICGAISGNPIWAEIASLIRQQATQLVDVPTWQSIETAPKTDGIVVLLAHEVEGILGIGYYSFAGWSFVAAQELAIGMDGTSLKMDRDSQPTHWMPLPTGPGDAPMLEF